MFHRHWRSEQYKVKYLSAPETYMGGVVRRKKETYLGGVVRRKKETYLGGVARREKATYLGGVIRRKKETYLGGVARRTHRWLRLDRSGMRVRANRRDKRTRGPPDRLREA